MSAPTGELLDANQVIQQVYNQTEDALQVDVVAGTLTVTNPSVGTNDATAPTSSTQIAAQDSSGNLIPLSVDASGNLNVNLTTTTIEIGKVDQGAPNTAANGWPVKPTDGTNSQSFTALGEAKVSITESLPSGTNNIGNINNITGTVSLPTGASTAANQSTEIAALGTINTTLGSPMQNSGGSVTANAGTNLNTSALALESGGNLAALNARLAGSLVPKTFDSQSISYVPSGNGAGQIYQVLYYTGGLSGTLVKTVTLSYDSSNRVISAVAT